MEDQIYLVIVKVDRKSDENTITVRSTGYGSYDTLGSFYTDSLIKVSDCLRNDDKGIAFQVYKFPSLERVTKADITIT